MQPTISTAKYDLYLGDCLPILREIEAGSVDLIFADPPYGIDFQSAWRTESERKPKIANDKRPFIWWLYDAYRITKQTGSILCCCRWDVQDDFKKAIEWAGFDIKSQVIWDRDWHGLGDLESQFSPQHDIIWFATKGNFAFPNKRPPSVIRARRVPAEELTHPNEKPSALIQRLIEACTCPGDIVLDCFLGSGVSGEVSVRQRRNFIGVEISEDYFEIAEKRIRQAALQMPFPEPKQEREPEEKQDILFSA